MTRRIATVTALVLAFGATAAVAIAIWPDRTANNETDEPPSATASVAGDAAAAADGVPGNSASSAAPDTQFALEPPPGPQPVRLPFKHPPAGGILFDVDNGRVLWSRNPGVPRPIASLTKMMTALLVAESDPPGARVWISAKAAHTPGSATGLLPKGRKVPLEPLLDALIMISANDAAVALAEHDGGSVTRFVKEMNAKATSMGLGCTHYTTPNGLRDRGNHSCPLDLAELARADLANSRIAKIAETRSAQPRFPIRGHRLYLGNNHYFLQRGLSGIPGARVTGLKTGFTDLAGRCYVTTAELGGHQLGVVLLRSPNPIQQVPALLRAGFQYLGDLPPGRPTTAPAKD